MYGLNPLGRARQARGLTLEDVAGLTKLSPRVLARIEAGDFSALPAGLLARAHLRAYARAVGLDAEDVVAALADRVPAAPDPLDAMRARVNERFAVEHPTAAALQRRVEALRKRAEDVVSQVLAARGPSAHRWRTIGASAIDVAILSGANSLMLLMSMRLTNAGVEELWHAARWPLAGSWGLTTMLYFTLTRRLTGQSTGRAVMASLSRMLEQRPARSAARGHVG